MLSQVSQLQESPPLSRGNGLRFLTIPSPALQGRGDVTLFVPRHEAESESLPLVLLLHGVYGSHWAWALDGEAHITAQRLIDAGRIRPMVLAMPSDGLFGDGSGYFAHNGVDYEGWIVNDVVRCVQDVVPELSVDSPLFIAGLSMGGFGALRLAAKHGSRFVAASAHSAFTEAAHLCSFLKVAPAVYGNASQEELGIIHWMKSNRECLPRIRFDCGLNDDFLPLNRQLHRAMNDLSIDHVYEEYRGGHTWDYWKLYIEKTLLFFEACSGETT